MMDIIEKLRNIPAVACTRNIEDTAYIMVGAAAREAAEEIEQLRQEVRELEFSWAGCSQQLKDACADLDEAEKEVAKLREKLAVAREALKESYIEFFYVNQQLNGVLDEDGEPLYTEGKSVTDALAKAKQTLTSTPEVALSEVRKAERERCAILCEKSDRYRGDYFAAKIRAMGDE